MTYFKLLLSTLLLLCLAPMPYGYYQLVRIVAMIGFAIMAYHYYEKEKVSLSIIFGGLGLLFQPFVKVALGRTMWNVVDVVVAVGLIALCIKEQNNEDIVSHNNDGERSARGSKWDYW